MPLSGRSNHSRSPADTSDHVMDQPSTPLYRQLNLQIMFGVTVMVILGVSSITPVLPTIMVEMEVPVRSIGLVITVFALPGVILAPLAGILADRLGRKKILVGSLCIFGVFGSCCALANDFSTLLIFRFLQGAGAASLGVLNATIISDLYDGNDRTTAFGYMGLVLSVGAAGLPAIGGALASLDWRCPFLLAGTALPLAWLVLVRLDNPEPQESQEFRRYLQATMAVIRTRRVLGLFVVSFLTISMLYGSFITYFPVLLKERFGVSPATIGLMMATSSIFTAMSASQLGLLTRRFRETSILRCAFVLHITALLVMPWMPSLTLFLIPVAVFGASLGLNFPSRLALLTRLAPPENRAGVMSINGMLLRLGQASAPAMMGMVVVGLGLHAVFIVAAAMAGLMLYVAAKTLD